MGKTRIALAVLLCICLLSFTAATVFLMPVSEDVIVTQKVVYGDSTVAQGLNVDFRCQYSNRLYWDIHCDPVTAQSNTDFCFSYDDPFYTYRENYLGVEMYPLLDHRSHTLGQTSRLSAPEGSGIARLIEDLDAFPYFKDEQNGSTTVEVSEDKNTHAIDLSDYFEYYPFEGYLELPFIAYRWFSHSEYQSDATLPEKQLDAVFNEYFKIPVKDNALVWVNVFQWRDGERDYFFGGFNGETTYFSPETYSFVSGDSCYFVFSSAQDHDTSLIPGGWGIYRLDYTLESGDLNFAALSTVYPLDPSVYVSGMTLSADGKTILLQRSDGQSDCLTVIDFATMEKLQEIQLWDNAQPGSSHVIIEDDYIVSLQNTTELSVYQKLENGTYEQRISIDIAAGEYVPDWNFYSDYGIAFDGAKLAVTNHLIQDVVENGYTRSYQTCGFTLSVYDNTGLLYYGEYDTSLAPVNLPVDMYGRRIYSYYNEPLVLTWE